MTKTEHEKKRRPFVSTQIILLRAEQHSSGQSSTPSLPRLSFLESPTAQTESRTWYLSLAPSAVLSLISKELFICYFPLTCGHFTGNAQIAEPASPVWLLGTRPWRHRESAHRAGKTGVGGLLAKVWGASRLCRQLSPELWLLLHLNWKLRICLKVFLV